LEQNTMSIRFGVRRKVFSALLVALVLGAAAYLRHQVTLPGRAPRPASQQRLCVRVVDGDTIEVDGGERVRLIGVDTPEVVDPRRPVQYFGKEASAFTRRMVEGKDVRLESDQETHDRYGRTLAYVYLQDGTLLNAEIIRQGYGHAYTRFPFRYERQFVELEREARVNGRGLWGR
jgi:micrococcal nuclease